MPQTTPPSTGAYTIVYTKGSRIIAKNAAGKIISADPTGLRGDIPINAALALGGHVYVSNSATNLYTIGAPLIIPSNTFLDIADGVELKMVTVGNVSENLLKNGTTTGTSGKVESATSPSTDISGGTATTFGISIDNDPEIHYIVLTLAGLNTGAAIAAAMQAAIQALPNGAGYTTATVTYSTVYTITSATEGPCSNVRIYAGLSNDVTAALKLITGATVTDGLAGNDNIRIHGGIWNFNNNFGGSEPHKVHVWQLWNVSNVVIKNPQFKNTYKYCMLITNAKNVILDNPNYLNVISDGNHFTGPLDNIHLSNIHGRTGDDMTAILASDFASYELSRGNIKNVFIDGVFSEGSAGVVTLGPCAPYFLTNIKISNVFGWCSRYHSILITDDTNITGGTINDITFRDIKCRSTSQCIAVSSTRAPGMTIKSLVIDGMDANPNSFAGILSLHGISPGSLSVESILINDVQSLFSLNDNPIYLSNGGAITVESLIINNVSVKNNASKAFLLAYTGTINHLMLCNARIDYADCVIDAHGTTCVIPRIYISNGYFGHYGTAVVRLRCNSIIQIENCYLNAVKDIIYQDVNNLTARVIMSNMLYAGAFALTNAGPTGNSISCNGASIDIDGALANVPHVGDQIFNSNAASLEGVGLYFYGSDTAWHKLA